MSNEEEESVKVEVSIPPKKAFSLILWAAIASVPTNIGVQMTGVFRSDPFTGRMGDELEKRQDIRNTKQDTDLLVLKSQVEYIIQSTPALQMQENTKEIALIKERDARLSERVQELERMCRDMGHKPK